MPDLSPLAPMGVGRELICRGCEEGGAVTEDQPGWDPHLVSLFVTGPDPHAPIRTPEAHIRWVHDPLHSYVNDGTGGLVIWAHPGPNDAEALVALDGLAGMELNYAGDGLGRERLWDRVLTLCHDRGSARGGYLWGYAADDTHSSAPGRIGLSFVVARLPEFSERALKHALRTGAHYVSNGPLISDIRVEGGTITITRPEPGEVRWLRSGQFGAGPAVVGPEPGEGHCLKRDVGVTASAYTVTDRDGTTDPASGRFVRALVLGAPGRVAQTMPFRILGPGRLANPYPAEGGWYRGQTHNHSDGMGFRRSVIHDFHRAYKACGHHWNFATDYAYWLTPFQRYPEGAAPTVRGITPDRGAPGAAVRVTVRGERLTSSGARLLIGGRPVTDLTWVFENRVEATVPADLPPGTYDVTFVAESGFQDTLGDGYTVQEPGADGAGWTTYTTLNSGLPGDGAFCVAPDPSSADGVWVGTQFGAARFDGAAWTAETRLNNACMGDAILSIAADRKGNVWFAHFRGLSQRCPDGAWRLYRMEQGLPCREINRVFVDSHDNVWITYNAKTRVASRFDGSTWQHITPPNGPKAIMSLAIAKDARGRILVAPIDSGVGVYDGTNWEVWTTENSGLSENYVRHIRGGPDGALYFATTGSVTAPAGGLSVLRNGEWTTHTESPGGLASFRVWDVCIDRAGRVWCATSRGVSRLDPNGAWTTFTTRNSGLAFDFVLGVCEAADGALWFATARGISRYKARSAEGGNPMTAPAP